MNILLASGSPRRRELLETLNVGLEVLKPEVEERQRLGESAVDYVLRNAKLKAEEVARRTDLPEGFTCLLSADTIVVQSGKILEKPKDDADATQMLHGLSGTQHEVVTGYYLLGLRDKAGTSHLESVTTKVNFKVLSTEEIRAYVASGEPHDKAGSYGIQGLASYMVSAISGSYSNVVGLPLNEVVAALQAKFGFSITVRSSLNV